MGKIIVQFHDKTECVYEDTAREILEQVRARHIYHIRNEGDAPKAWPGQAKGPNANVIAIKMLKKGMSREDVAEVLNIDIESVPEIVAVESQEESTSEEKDGETKTIDIEAIPADKKAQVWEMKRKSVAYNKISSEVGVSIDEIRAIVAAGDPSKA